MTIKGAQEEDEHLCCVEEYEGDDGRIAPRDHDHGDMGSTCVLTLIDRKERLAQLARAAILYNHPDEIKNSYERKAIPGASFKLHPSCPERGSTHLGPLRHSRAPHMSFRNFCDPLGSQLTSGSTPGTTEKLLEAQNIYAYCTLTTETVETLGTTLKFNQHGCLVRRSKINGVLQPVVPESKRARVLYLSHYRSQTHVRNHVEPVLLEEVLERHSSLRT